MKNILLAVLYSVFLVSLQSCDKIPGLHSELKDDDAKATKALIGIWRGEGTYEDEEDAGWAESWKMVRGSDGTYQVDYMIVHDGDKLFEQSTDVGSWSYEAGAYYEVNSNGNKITYDVFSVKTDWFEYNIAQRQGSANIQESKTVENFQLQNPPEGYSEVTYEQPEELSVEIQVPEVQLEEQVE